MSETGEGQSLDRDTARIADILAKDGVREIVQKNIDAMNQLGGHNLISGITADGLVVVVREGVHKDVNVDGYFQAIALNASLPIDQIEEGKIEAKFAYDDTSRLRDGGTTYFPGMYLGQRERDITAMAELPEDEARAKLGDRFPMLQFYKATGGFTRPTQMNFSNPNAPKEPNRVGKKILYPLPASQVSQGSSPIK